MTLVLIDDHLLRDVLSGERPTDLDGLASGLATTGLWFFRLNASFSAAGPSGKLSAPVSALSSDAQRAFRSKLLELPDSITVLSLRDLAFKMAELQQLHREQGRGLSALMAEALAAARHLGCDIAVSSGDVGKNLAASAESEGIAFHVLQ